VELWSISPNHNSTRACRKIIANMAREANPQRDTKAKIIKKKFFVSEPE
jgi:hypothetical protein